MTDLDILDGFTRILRDLLDDDSLELTMQTVRTDVAGWDSLAYMNFIVAVEMEFDVKFKVAEVESFRTVGEIVQRVRPASS